MLWFLCFFLDGGAVAAAEKKATVFGTPTANLRSGAGAEHPLKWTLKEGDQVSVEKLEGEWYQVTAVDGQKGYVHKNLLKLVDEALAQQPAPPTPAQKPAAADPKEPAKNGAAASIPAQSNPAPVQVVNEPPTPPPAPRAAPAKSPEPSSPSILQMLEGHEVEIKIGLVIAGIAFVLGWVCGGSYYLRRERKSWRKLRL